MAYRLALPPQLSKFDDVFYASISCNYLWDHNRQISFIDVQVDEKLDLPKLLVKIVDE